MPGNLGPLIMLFVYIGLFIAKEGYTLFAVMDLAKKFTIEYNNIFNIVLIPVMIVYCVMMLCY